MIIKEWIKKDEVMDIIKGLPQDLWEEYIYMLKGVWCDEEAHGLADEAKRMAKEYQSLQEMVRCKDCNRGFGSSVCPIQSQGWAINMDTFYCAWGERREP